MATHILTGNRIGDPPIKRLLKDVVLHFVPGVDPGFDDIPDNCNPLVENEVGQKVLDSFKEAGRESDPVTKAFREMLSAEDYNALVIIGGGAKKVK